MCTQCRAPNPQIWDCRCGTRNNMTMDKCRQCGHNPMEGRAQRQISKYGDPQELNYPGYRRGIKYR